jgi:hypothetical protein
MPFLLKKETVEISLKRKDVLEAKFLMPDQGDDRVVPGFFLGALVKLIEN